jgi:hypothetical protein
MNLRVIINEYGRWLLFLAFCCGMKAFIAGTESMEKSSQFKVNSITLKPLPVNSDEEPRRFTIQFSVGYELPTQWWHNAIYFLIGQKEYTPPGWKDVVAIQCESMRFINQNGKEFSLTAYSGGPSFYADSVQTHSLKYTAAVPDGYDITRRSRFAGTVIALGRSGSMKPLGQTRFSVPVQLN